MKLKGMNYYTAITCTLFIASGSVVYGGTMGPESVAPIDALYIGVFGGGGGVTNDNLSQEGTAFYGAAKGGPLAVNARGKSNGSSEWMVGGHVGYQWPARLFNHISPNWTFAPATELEGYYIGGATFKGDDLNNDTTRLTEHDFRVTYPLHTGVFLVNAILNANHFNFGKFHPYVGVGAGAAVISITGANSTQKTPAEPGINHYNSGTSDTSLVFAAQPKMGVSFNLSQNTNMFVEYRFLYLSASDFTFGSTVYPTHVATSNWDVKMGSQYYNMGTIGIQYDL
jgi:opacity protein-like surface antigen